MATVAVAVAMAMEGCEQWAGARKGWLEGRRSWEEMARARVRVWSFWQFD